LSSFVQDFGEYFILLFPIFIFCGSAKVNRYILCKFTFQKLIIFFKNFVVKIKLKPRMTNGNDAFIFD